MKYIFLIILFLIAITVVYYFIRIWKYSIQPRYENKHGMELYNVPIDFHGERLGLTYGDYSKGIFRVNQYDFDDEGVFIFIDTKENIVYYNPCGIAEFALISWGNMILYPNDALKYEKMFFSQLKWLDDNKLLIDNKAVWYYNYPNHKSFFSGISQGMIISVLLRAWQHSNNKYYKDLALKAYNFLSTPIKNGGVLYQDEKYKWWYEEDIKVLKILNGHIYSLLGNWDLYRVTGDKEVYNDFFKGIQDIKNNIKDFDLGFYTKYDAFNPYPANNSYHYTHITLFHILYGITNDSFFDCYMKKFDKYHKKWYYKCLNFGYLFCLTIMDKFKK